MILIKQYSKKWQDGYILVTSLVFLTVLTLLSVVAIQSTGIEYQMSTNLALKDRAFQSSETGRINMGGVLDAHIFERGWGSNISLPSGLSVLDKDSSGDMDNLYLGNSVTEDLYNDTSLVSDALYRIDSNSDGDFTDAGDIESNLTVYKTKSINAAGSGAAMVSGYEGLGKAAAAGGVHTYFELRSRGITVTGAQVNTVSEFRAVIRN